MTETTQDANKKPSVKKELERAAAQFDAFDQNVKELTMDRMNAAPREEKDEPRVSSRQIEKDNSLYLKPKRSLHAVNKSTAQGESFDEKYRADYNFQKEYVNFIFENKEIIGETCTIWTKPFKGIPAEEWEIPTNRPLWGPRYLAEQIKRKFYHRLVMKDVPREQGAAGTIYGVMAADTTIQRLDAYPVNQRKSIFMGASSL